jgi:intracellular sulfur oxidation DsrE/DsrF family protein
MKSLSGWGRNRWFVVAALFVIALGIGGVVAANNPTKIHHIVLQINSDDTVPMKHAISNAINLVTHYRAEDQDIAVEFVAYGPGITMFRTDTSPVLDILKYIRSNFPEISFTICGNAKAIIEQREGHPMPLVTGTRVVPFGVVRLVELQEAGWAYIRP